MASRSTTVAVYASTLCLPALSVALGRDHRHRHYHSSEAAAVDDEAAAASTPTVITDVDTVQLAIRATNNVSRMYARRILDAAKLEREHPYYAAAPSSSSSSSASSFTEATIERTMTTKDEIVKGAFTTLIDIREKINYIQSQLIASTTAATSSSSHHRGGNNVACCESSSAKQKTLEDYNKLNLQTFGTLDQYTVIDADNNNNGNGDGSKPAEWSDHTIDLAKRRDEFGKQISPLTNVSAVERWYMACKRVVTLSCLAMPLATLVPLNIVLGKLVVSSSTTNGDGDAAGTTTTTITTTKASSTKNTALAPPPADVVGIKKSGGIATRLHTRLTNKTWDYALWAIETAGPTYIKLVQWASTRHDLFSSEFVSHFRKLQDETRGHSWDETENTLVRAFGPNWRNIITFDIVIDDGEENNEHVNGSSDSGGGGGEGGELQRRGGVANRARQGRLEHQSTKKNKLSKSTSSHPIGSGCVAQVYKARLTTSHGLHPPGTSVAVKVQHPRILEKVCLDFYIMNKVAAFLEYIPYLNLDYLSVKDSVDQFRDIMLPQLDLRVEGHNLQRFRRDFDGETQIAFPEPLLGLTSREVLVERFVEGEPMLNYVLCEDEKHSKKDREELATIGLETVMKMIFLHDFVHADLHPGNMIVDRNKNARGNPLRMHMIDCGLTVELGERDHKNLVKILGSLIKRDGYAAGKLMVDTAKKCQATELDVELFCRGMEKICVDDEDNNFLESVGDYITDICYLACKHKVKLEAAFINAALACEIMEGLASSLYPDMLVQRIALPMVLKAEMMHGMKGLPDPRLWSLSDLRK